MNDKTGIQAVVRVAGWSVSVNSWRFWITLCVAALMGDHLGQWDVDSIYGGGSLDLNQVVFLVSSIMAVLSSFGKRQQTERRGDIK